MKFVTLATISFSGRAEPEITVRASGTKEEDLRKAVRAVSAELGNSFYLGDHFLFEERRKDKEYAFVDRRVTTTTGQSNQQCIIGINFAIEHEENFFKLDQFYPINLR
ncbi:hypothetical protein IGS75_01390 [Gluconobacter sphaericus]|uniref:hypothetical protein n=1 Tax=Gluconobacter sphaericus TaxID=574987 RepID=UPI001924CABA|nr:hypothetical protein [Gluconobacter sphaericus]QQX91324.1 hypothetical protein IGS75_01390 [Gluconobacter sphaericus]